MDKILQGDGPLFGTRGHEIDALIDRFEEAWQLGQQPSIGDFLPAEPARRAGALLALVAVDLEYRWKLATSFDSVARSLDTTVPPTPTVGPPPRPRIEDYLREFPDLGVLDALPLELIAAEYRARHRWGDRPSHSEYSARFPALVEDLAVALSQVDQDLAAEQPNVIEKWWADEPVTAHREPIARRVARWVRKHKTLAAASVIMLVVGGIVAAAIGMRAREHARALATADSLLTANAATVPFLLRDLRLSGRLALERLHARFNDPQIEENQRVRTAYGLAELGEGPEGFLVDAVTTAPAAECRNLVAALDRAKASALPELAQREAKATDATTKARYAIVALHLVDAMLAKESLAVRSDPIHRTTLIHAFAGWHGDLSVATDLFNSSDDPAFRSGLCAAFGTIAPETLEPGERERAAEALFALYTNAPDGGTHAAAGWALRQWKQDLPALAPTPRARSDRRWFVNGQGMTMVEIAAGKFTMGTPRETTQGDPEGPAHEVTLTTAFHLADREVSVEQFQRFIEDAEYAATEKPQGWQEEFQQWKQYIPTSECPVINVNWFDAVLYCNWLSTRENRTPCYERTGEKERFEDYLNVDHEYDVWRRDFAADGYRLPTEAEWEYASRAGSTAEFCYGSDEDLLPQYAWFVGNAKTRTWPGGAKLPSAFGLFDMHGNVWEWCWDWYGEYAAGAVCDPTGPVVHGGGSRSRRLSSFRRVSDPTGPVVHGVWSGRVLRGGAFSYDASDCRSARRHEGRPMFRFYNLGFRVCCGR